MQKKLKNPTRYLRTLWLKSKQKKIFRQRIQQNLNKSIKIVVGSSGKYQDGWIPTEIYFLNLLKEKDWLKYFKEDSIDYILGEHVWEHLTPEQGKLAAKNCFKFLKHGGKLRVAVPDGFHNDENYINYVKPGGNGLGADDHKVLYNYKTFSSVFTEIGFEVELLEYFNESQVFITNRWSEEEGYIQRSIKHDPRNKDGKPNYTSLILDAIKK
jgi:predicted SAM-dependent methyltransferase